MAELLFSGLVCCDTCDEDNKGPTNPGCSSVEASCNNNHDN